MDTCLACHVANEQTACDLCHEGRRPANRITSGTFAVTHGPQWRPRTGWAMPRPAWCVTSRVTAWNVTARACPTAELRRDPRGLRARTRSVQAAMRHRFATRVTALPCRTRSSSRATTPKTAAAGSATCKRCHAESDCTTCHGSTSTPAEPSGGATEGRWSADADRPAPPSELLSYLTLILLNPTSNLRAAFLVYGSIALILLIVLVIAIIIIMGSTKEDEASQGHGGGAARRRSAGASEACEAPDEPARAPRCCGGHRVGLGAAWTLAGYTTSDPALCKNCHWPASEHAKALPGTDPHATVPCISCHESGGTLGRYLPDVPARLIHFADTQSAIPAQEEYGRVTVAACSACHEAALVGVATNETRDSRSRTRSRWPHLPPASIATRCEQVWSARTTPAWRRACAVTMRSRRRPNAPRATTRRSRQPLGHAPRRLPTSRYPNSRAAAATTRSKSATRAMACGFRIRPSSWCTRMPAPAPWTSGTTAARRALVPHRLEASVPECHRRPSVALMGRGRAGWRAGTRRRRDRCDTCHRTFAYPATRDFCKDLCHTPAAVEGSSR